MERNLDLAKYPTATKIKRILSSLADYFLLVILAFSLFTLVGKPVYHSLPLTSETQSRYQEKETELIRIIEGTGLQSYDNTRNRLTSLSEKSKEYIDVLVKTSFYASSRDYEEISEGKKTIRKVTLEETFYSDEKKDSLSYYFLSFRKENQKQYQKELSLYDNAGFQKEILLLDGSNQDLVGTDFVLGSDFVLSADLSDSLLYYQNYGEGEGEKYYQRISSLFVSASQKGIAEIESDYLPYLSAMAEMKEAFQQYVFGYDLAMVIVYSLSFLVYFVLLPLAFKRGRTAVCRLMRLCPIQTDGFPLEAKSLILRDIVLFLTFFHGIFFLALFSNQLSILSYSFIGPISMFQLVIFTFLLSLLSLIFIFVSKDNQTLSDFASNSCVVDLNQPIGKGNDHGKPE